MFQFKRTLIVLLFFSVSILSLVLYKITTIDALASRKIITIIVGISLYLLMLYTVFKYGIPKFLFIFIVFIPFWMRSSFYFGYDVLPNHFNYLTFDIILFLLVSVLLVLATLKKNSFKVDKVLFLTFAIFGVYTIATLFNIYIRVDVKLIEYDIVIINFLLPMIIFASFYFYIFNSQNDVKELYIKAMNYFYTTIILFAIIELLIKGQHIFSNPSMFLQYGLRFPSLADGSQIISGGLRDMLYFAFLEAIYPLIGIIFLKYNIINMKQYRIFLGISILFVLAIYSKAPILLLLINLYFANKYIHFIKIKNLIKFLPFLILVIFLIFNSFTERISKFSNVLVALFVEDNRGAAMSEESSAAGRLIKMIDRFQEFLSSPWIGQSALDIVNNSFVFLLSSYGIIFTLFILSLILIAYKQLSALGRNILFSWFIFSLVDFGVIFEIGGVRNHLLHLTQESYIQYYGWVPCYSTANIYVSTLLMVLVFITCNKNPRLNKKEFM